MFSTSRAVMQQSKDQKLDILLISDSTGDTVTAAMKAAVSQFPRTDARYRIFPFVQRLSDIEAIDDQFFRHASMLAFTIVDPRLKQAVLDRCHEAGLPALAVIDPLVDLVGRLLDSAPTKRPGQQYRVDQGYLERVKAIDFAISHDDGRKTEDHLLASDVILIGVSRTSKTPTCIYLGYQGIKAANVPLVLGQPEPEALRTALGAGVPGVGLIASTSRLAQIRKTRLRSLGTPEDGDYTDPRHIEEELIAARLLFERYGLPIIDVTRRSIEETAAAIRHHLARETL